MHIDEIVVGLIDTYKTNNPYELLKEMDIKVIEVEKDSKFLLGKNALFIDVLNKIFIRNDLNDNYKLFYLRHELGHILLHLSKFNTMLPNNLKREKEADYFALKLSQLQFDEIDMYQMTYEQIASCLELPQRVIKQLANL